MTKPLKIDDYIEVHMSKKAFIWWPTLHVRDDSHDGYDTIHQIYLGNGIIMHLMHDCWSAFILIANRSGVRISTRTRTVHSGRPPKHHWKSLNAGIHIFVGQG